MDITWTLEKIENYRRASEYTAFHKKLSVLAEPYLDERWTLADIGCGPGLLARWIAPMVASVDAIDTDATAIEYLKARLSDVFQTNKAAFERIKPRRASLDDLEGEIWDVVGLSFFGVNEEILTKALRLAKRGVAVYMHGKADDRGPLAPINDGGKFSVAELEAFLKEKGFTFRKTVMEMQFGQPFKTIDEIHAFLLKYGGKINREIECIDLGADGDMDDERIKRIAHAEERIIKTNRFDYPYYLPKSVSVAMFIILGREGEVREGEK